MKTLPSGRPSVIDLFAGAGGLSLGFEQAGFDIVAAVEFDPIHAAVHEFNFPYSTIIPHDIRRLTGFDIRQLAGLEDREIDVVIGGPPCQGFSLIGYRVLEDVRNELVFHFQRMVLDLQPRLFVMENVPGMATGRHTQLLDELIARFERAGYQVRSPYCILNAAHFGVPQDRRRLFLLGARSDVPLPEYPIPMFRLPAHGRRRSGREEPHSLDSLPLTKTVEDAIGDLPNVDEYPSLFETDELLASPIGGALYAQKLRGEVTDENDFSYLRQYEREWLTGCLRARHTELSIRRFNATPPGTVEPVSRFLRLANNGVSHTLRAGTATDRGAFSAPRPIHPLYPRCITVREAARLHSYPDWFRFHRTIWHGFRQIGNSVPPLLGRSVGAALLKALGVEPIRPTITLPPGSPYLVAFNMREAARHFGVSHTVIPPRKRLATSARI